MDIKLQVALLVVLLHTRQAAAPALAGCSSLSAPAAMAAAAPWVWVTGRACLHDDSLTFPAAAATAQATAVNMIVIVMMTTTSMAVPFAMRRGGCLSHSPLLKLAAAAAAVAPVAAEALVG